MPDSDNYCERLLRRIRLADEQLDKFIRWQIPRSFRWLSRQASIITILISAAGWIIIFCTLKATNKQAEVAVNNLLLSYPAKLQLFDVILRDDKGQEITTMTPSMHYNGRAQFINIGRHHATIQKTVCYSAWYPKNLPMVRPYLTDKPDCILPKPNDSTCAFDNAPPGCVLNVVFEGILPNDLKGALYFMGYILYKDKYSKSLFMLFARKFDQSESRFVIVNNRNYEYEPDLKPDPESDHKPDGK